MSINIPTVNRKDIIHNIKRNILDKVILRLDYCDIFYSDNFASEVAKKLGDKFSIRSEEQGKLFEVSNGDVLPGLDIISHVLKDEKTGNGIKINNRFFVIECAVYENFETLIEIFNSILDIYFALFKGNELQRIGFRKINFYDKKESKKLVDFKGYFNKYLTHHLDKKLLAPDLDGDSHSLVVNDSQFKLVLNYGTLKGNIKNSNARRFILDIDCSSTENIHVESMQSRIVEMNNKIFDIFYWSIDKKLKEELTK